MSNRVVVDFVEGMHNEIQRCAIDNAIRFDVDKEFKVVVTHDDIKTGTYRARVSSAMISEVRQELIDRGYVVSYLNSVITIVVKPLSRRKDVYTLDEIRTQNIIAKARKDTASTKTPKPTTLVGRD